MTSRVKSTPIAMHMMSVHLRCCAMMMERGTVGGELLKLNLILDGDKVFVAFVDGGLGDAAHLVCFVIAIVIY